MTDHADLLPRVRATIAREALLVAGDTALVAVSGGADSLSLLHLLGRLAPELNLHRTVAVFDHGWRPESAVEAEATAAWVKAQGHDVRLGRAEQPRRDEAAARQQRHAFLEQCRIDAGARRIALGHSADDRAETLLLNLLRGTGTHGLGAMPAASGSLVRPLLDCARAELAAYAAHHRLPIITDPTNAGGNLRARVRHELLPLIEQLRPGARSALARTAAICDSERQALDRYAARLLAQRAVDPPAESFTAGVRAMAIEVSDWSALPTGERHLLLRAWLAAFVGRLAEVDFALIDALDTLAAGRADAQPLAWPRVLGDATAVRCGSRLWLGCWPDLAPWGPLPLGGPMPAGVPVITPDAPLLAQTLRPANYQVRSRRPGDSYQPAGRPRKPLGDWLAELGVPLPLRDRVPLLIDRDTIAWLPGLLPAADYRASSGARLGVVS